MLITQLGLLSDLLIDCFHALSVGLNLVLQTGEFGLVQIELMSPELLDLLFELFKGLLLLVVVVSVTEAFAQFVKSAALHDAEERLNLAIRVVEVLAQLGPSPVLIIKLVDVALSERLVEQVVQKVALRFLAWRLRVV